MANPNSKFRKWILIAYSCGIASFVIGVTGVLLESVFNYSTATSVGGQMVFPGMIAGICGFAIYQFLIKRKFISTFLSYGLGLGLFGFLCSLLVQAPSDLKGIIFVGGNPFTSLICGLFGGLVAGMVSYFSYIKKRKTT